LFRNSAKLLFKTFNFSTICGIHPTARIQEQAFGKYRRAVIAMSQDTDMSEPPTTAGAEDDDIIYPEPRADELDPFTTKVRVVSSHESLMLNYALILNSFLGLHPHLHHSSSLTRTIHSETLCATLS